MEQILVNAKLGKTRRETLHGRSYLVAPATLLVEGVLAGSRGPLFYPREEITRDASTWNHMPIVVRHPMSNGQPVSAREPSVLEKSGIGSVYRAKGNTDRLTAEAWFDVEKTRQVDVRILNALEAGLPIELSTGLFTHNDPAEPDATFNGVAYHAIARNYQPDHLAILPDERGACSIKDGCGILNKETANAFCPTGEGGGVDPSCASGDGSSGSGDSRKEVLAELRSARAAAKSTDRLATAMTPFNDPDHFALRRMAERLGEQYIHGAGGAISQRKTLLERAGEAKTLREKVSGMLHDAKMSLSPGEEISAEWKNSATKLMLAAHKAEKGFRKAHDFNMKLAKQKGDRPIANVGSKSMKKSTVNAAIGGNVPSHEELQDQLEALIHERFPMTKPMADMPGMMMQHGQEEDCCIEAVYDKQVVFEMDDKYYSLGYTYDLRTGEVSLADATPVEVREITSYQPVSNAMTKMMDGEDLPMSAFAYHPDPEMPSTWKLRIDDAAHVGGAIAAIGKGFRGEKVDIPEADMAAVKDKIRAAWKKFHPDSPSEDMPEIIRNENAQPGPEQSNTGGAMPLTPQQREEHIAYLTANCICWQGEKDREVLNTLPDGNLERLKAGVEKSKQTPPVAPPVANTQRLTAEEQETLNWARQEQTRQKSQLVERLTANVSDPQAKQTQTVWLMAKPKEELESLLMLLPAPTQNQRQQYPAYAGAGGGMYVPAPSYVNNVDPGDVLDLDTYRRSQEQSRKAQ